MKKYILEITVFLCGALGMILELVAARVLSPYVGSSNLIWTTIIGVMLISMSLGYWIGGKLSDKYQSKKLMSSLLLIGAIFTSLVPIFETILVKNLSTISNNLVLIAFGTSAIIFGIPSFVLATVSPFAVKLKNKEMENVGKVSGIISSLSTIGSIVGTFTAGFILIPSLGIRTIIVGISAILIILSILLNIEKSKAYVIKLLIAILLVISLNYIGKVIFENQNKDILKDIDSEYSRIWVKQVNGQTSSYKTLQVDTGLESYIDKNTGKMGATYLNYYDLFNYYNKNAKSTLMIGGAAYTYPTHYLNKYNDKTIDVSEIDEKMTQIAKEEFDLDVNNSRLKIYHQDGRSFLNYTKNKYDCILIDAFKGLNAPFELTTYEALTKAKNILNENGIVITNIISALEGEKSEFIKYEYSTYKAIFDEVKLLKVNSDVKEEMTQNLILIGIKGNANINESKYTEYEDLLKNEVKEFKGYNKIVTDEFAPIGN